MNEKILDLFAAIDENFRENSQFLDGLKLTIYGDGSGYIHYSVQLHTEEEKLIDFESFHDCFHKLNLLFQASELDIVLVTQLIKLGETNA